MTDSNKPNVTAEARLDRVHRIAPQRSDPVYCFQRDFLLCSIPFRARPIWHWPSQLCGSDCSPCPDAEAQRRGHFSVRSHHATVLRMRRQVPARAGWPSCGNKRKPIPARLKRELKRYRWSSHRAYAGLYRAPPPWVCLDWLSCFGRTRRVAHAAYRRQIDQMFGQVIWSPWEDLRHGLVLGGDAMWDKVRGLSAGWLPRRRETRKSVGGGTRTPKSIRG